MTDITVPTLGESITEATVGQWLKAKGDAVKKDDVLVELETDKVSVEVSATEDGVLGEILAQPGDTVEIGALLGRLEGGAGGSKPTPAAAAPAKEEAKPAAAPAASGGGSTDIVVPVMGESVAEGTLSTFLKQPGDAVKKDETIAEIETDKVALEVPAPADGVIAEWTVAEGTSVTPGRDRTGQRVCRGFGCTDCSCAGPESIFPGSCLGRPSGGAVGPPYLG
jgi:2-oxoglutarate dehydrogenase E2 component (dihydrolipoamide succinyltransferase)